MADPPSPLPGDQLIHLDYRTAEWLGTQPTRSRARGCEERKRRSRNRRLSEQTLGAPLLPNPRLRSPLT
jgi:hypothetical protein